MGTRPRQYAAPKSVEEAVSIMRREENASYLAGGTDLVPLMKNGLNRTGCLIGLEGIASLKNIEETSGAIFIGAMVALSEAAKSPVIDACLAPLAYAARCVASPQIRNLGTVGGNILQEKRCYYFNQSEYWRQSVAPCHKLGGDVCYQIPKAKTCRAIYYSDLAPVLLAYDARVQFFDGETYRESPLEEVIRADYSGGHLLTGFHIPKPVQGAVGKFWKYSVRGAIDFALSQAAMVFSNNDDHQYVRVFAGAVAPEPVRLSQTEEIILNSLPDLLSRKKEIIETGINEIESRSALIRETTVSFSAKKHALLIIAEALRDFLPRIQT
jgi:CO/xanthine dehydrogenase FAD-binding subunit